MRIYKIKVYDCKDRNCWVADCVTFSGMPMVGMGKNKYEAVGSLCFLRISMLNMTRKDQIEVMDLVL